MEITETTRGRFEVRRTEDEPPFALLLAPRYHRNGKAWSLHYRSPAPPHFDDSNRNAGHPTRESAEHELTRLAKHSTPFQLGLTDEIPTPQPKSPSPSSALIRG